MAERTVSGWAESPIDIALIRAEHGLMAMMGPAGILLFTRYPERTRPERTRSKALAQERQPRAGPRIDAVIRAFRRRAHRNRKNTPSPNANRRPANAVGLIAAQEGRDD
jgi:hypothetical protein